MNEIQEKTAALKQAIEITKEFAGSGVQNNMASEYIPKVLESTYKKILELHPINQKSD